MPTRTYTPVNLERGRASFVHMVGLALAAGFALAAGACNDDPVGSGISTGAGGYGAGAGSGNGSGTTGGTSTIPGSTDDPFADFFNNPGTTGGAGGTAFFGGAGGAGGVGGAGGTSGQPNVNDFCGDAWRLVSYRQNSGSDPSLVRDDDGQLQLWANAISAKSMAFDLERAVPAGQSFTFSVAFNRFAPSQLGVLFQARLMRVTTSGVQTVGRVRIYWDRFGATADDREYVAEVRIGNTVQSKRWTIKASTATNDMSAGTMQISLANGTLTAGYWVRGQQTPLVTPVTANVGNLTGAVIRMGLGNIGPAGVAGWSATAISSAGFASDAATTDSTSGITLASDIPGCTTSS